MWRSDPAKLIKVRLHSNGEDAETPWAEDCGPAPAPAGARYVRLGNVPFLRGKPTYGDVVVVTPDADGVLAWDSEQPPDDLEDRIIEDGGRWLMILEYALVDAGGDAQRAFAALDVAAQRSDIVVEGCFGPTGGEPGLACLAVPDRLDVDQVLAHLERQRLPVTLSLVHPVEATEEEEDAVP